ncbi:ABC transporter ATP-binding protein [Rhodobacter sp. 24-YEA-8]|uniref:ABC transporter ATP-binding protein n=1 Tax=Rhodobacter sp. 24-YEA-8 TaxID=1884310 RepID=UPI0008982BC7|nr:ABC transporter ATP-binding protein [Rhodobacter sp. 24-YEA-8]SED11322.1 peptide/nickel transport system ATP-binding protein [Rhodobacter sp. 24-YEA-8]
MTVTNETPAPILSIRDLSVSFLGARKSWNRVIEGLSFDISPGETVALVGESGSGKSVTSLSVMGLLDPATSRIEGEISLAGHDVLKLDEAGMIRHIRGQAAAMIFQEPMTSLHPIYRVGDQITEALTSHHPMPKAEARKQAIALLERVRIPNAARRMDDYPHAFSGGMRQRVMIAMALASRPKLLIADEPTTALDVTVQGEILDLLKDLQAEYGMAMLFITHDMGVVAEMADRTVVMLRGRSVEQGPTAEIFATPREPYTKALLASVPVLGSMTGAPAPLRFPLVDMASGVAGAALPLQSSPDMRAPILDVQDLVTRFDVRGGLFNRRVAQVHAVENVSFRIFPGETLSLVGESGCGKSTTGKSIIRLNNRSTGSVKMGGDELFALRPEAMRLKRREIQMIPQDPLASMNPRMTVGDALVEPFTEHRMGTAAEGRAKAATLMEQVGLTRAMLERYPHEFSGGQRQRVCIARALMLDPKLIIADESVSALDVSVKAQVVNLLLDIQDRLGIAFLFISHDIAVVERVSHRIAVMYMGEIVEIGPRAEIMERPRHAYTRQLIGAVTVPDPARRHLRRNQQVKELKTPIRPLGFKPPERRYEEVSPGHLVMIEA